MSDHDIADEPVQDERPRRGMFDGPAKARARERLKVLIDLDERKLPLFRIVCVHGDGIELDERGPEEHMRAIFDRMAELAGDHEPFLMRSDGRVWDVWSVVDASGVDGEEAS